MEFTVPVRLFFRSFVTVLQGDIAELMDGSSGCFQVQDEYDMSSMSTSDQDRHLEGTAALMIGTLIRVQASSRRCAGKTTQPSSLMMSSTPCLALLGTNSASHSANTHCHRSFMSLDAEVKSQVWSSLHNGEQVAIGCVLTTLTGMSTLSAYLSVSLEELQAASTEGSEARNSVKMLMFLLNHMCLLEESEAAKATKHVSKVQQ